MRDIAVKENYVELNLTDEEFILVTSTNIGMKFFSSGKIEEQDKLLDARIKLSESISKVENKDIREDIQDEISCVDFLLSLRTYLEESSPKSIMLIENLVDNNSAEQSL